jgi:hypothetical protein
MRKTRTRRREAMPPRIQEVMSMRVGGWKLMQASELVVFMTNFFENSMKDRASQWPSSSHYTLVWVRFRLAPLYLTATLYFSSSSRNSSHSMSDSKGIDSTMLNPYAFKAAAMLES